MNPRALIAAIASCILSASKLLVPSPRRLALAAFAAAAFGPAVARSNPVLGFIEEFPGTTVGSVSGGSPFSNPGADGYLGPADGYLLFKNNVPTAFGVRADGAEYLGNWTAAGVTQIRVWMNDVGADEALDMHFALGNGVSNFWHYNVGFAPPLHQWGEYVIDLTSDANWTQIIGSGTFASALTDVDRILIRHDPPPFQSPPTQPDPIAADVGVDHLLLTNGLVGVDPFVTAATHPVELAPPYPNPSRGPVSFAVRAADAGPIQIQILDVQGRIVRSAKLADSGSGPRIWLWDGRDDSGRAVAAGYYRVRATGAAGGTSRPLVRIN